MGKGKRGREKSSFFLGDCNLLLVAFPVTPMAEEALQAECKCWLSDKAPQCKVSSCGIWFQIRLLSWPVLAARPLSWQMAPWVLFWSDDLGPGIFCGSARHTGKLCYSYHVAQVLISYPSLSPASFFFLPFLCSAQPGSRYARPLSKQMLSGEQNGSAPIYTHPHFLQLVLLDTSN